MPRTHLESDESTAVCCWPWSNEAANFEIIEKYEMGLWLTADIKEVTCSKCIKQHKKTGTLEQIENNGRGSGWLIKISKVIPALKGPNTLYVVSMKKDGSMMCGTAQSMGKVYKTERNALKTCAEISNGGHFTTELIKI